MLLARSHIVILLFLLAACSKERGANPGPEKISLLVPGHFPAAPVMTDNPLTREGVELGRMLFYDSRLSGNNQVSCATCHHPEKAFSDGVALSTAGISGKPLHRTSPALINMAWATNGLFWDGGSTNLESQAFGPLQHADEMQQNLEELVQELNAVPAYQRLFRVVFQDEIKPAYVARALAQFQRTLISGNARYDQYMRQEPGIQLNATELHGLQLVNTHCRSCHAGALFTDNDYHNNGLDSDFSDDSAEGMYQGRSRITYDPSDLGKFRTPTLRNVMVTAPYMHDGCISTIEGVLQHYSHDIKTAATTDARLMPNGLPGLGLTAAEQQAVIAFLGTLTDSSFLNNPSLGKPVIP